MSRPAVFILTTTARPVAANIARELDGEIIALGDANRSFPARSREGGNPVEDGRSAGSPPARGRAESRSHRAEACVPDAIRSAFREGRPIIGLCAAGILIRVLAPLLGDKLSEPPVVAVAEDGSAAVPLLGGHRGANELARRIARLTGGTAAVTTASDLRLGVALDDPPPGYVLANPEHVKTFAARLIAGEPVRIEGGAPWLSNLQQAEDARLTITVSPKAVEGGPERLVFHPKSLAVGVGCERGAEPEELIGLVRETLAAHRLASQSLAGVFSLDLKADEPAVHALARDLGVPARFFSAARLNEEAPRLLNPSAAVMREVGCPGVSEGAALAAAGPGSHLIVAKTRSARCTCAVAEAPAPLIEIPGRPRGHLAVVGIGPGSREWLAPAAAAALERATDWVGYGLYLDLVAQIAAGKTLHRFPLGAEEERVRKAIALAGEGRSVALVSSGDPGIYAMASLVCEIIEREPARIAVEVIPGISAFQAAAARAGAIIGHDFCCISLSDLLTPWDVIEKRVRAAAKADLVTALYNPRSARRTDQLSRAIAILKPHRRPETPVVVASNLGRPDESIRIVTLSAFDPAQVDMLTVVLVGSSESRAFARGDGTVVAYTPRGYASKVTA